MKSDPQAPVFTVIIPTRNRAHLLLRAVSSVVAQTFQDFELIIVDDASTDPTPEVVGALKDPRIVYLRREQNGSAAAARNTGIRHARSSLIALLDDDDEYLPRFLECTAAAFEGSPPSVGLSWCGKRVVRETPTGEKIVSEGFWQPTFRNREEAYLAFLRRRSVGTAGGLVIRRACFEIVGYFDERMSKAEDTDLLIRLVRQFDFVVVPEILITRHAHAGPRLTVYDTKMAEAYERIMQKHQEALSNHASLAAALHYKVGWLYYWGGDRKKARQHLRRALQRSPLHLKSWANLVLFECLGARGRSIHERLSFLNSRLARRPMHRDA